MSCNKCRCSCQPDNAPGSPTRQSSSIKPLTALEPGQFITVRPGVLGFICWILFGDGENSFGNMIGYLGTDGEYHERDARDEYEYWHEHPVIGAKRHLETQAAEWARD